MKKIQKDLTLVLSLVEYIHANTQTDVQIRLLTSILLASSNSEARRKVVGVAEDMRATMLGKK